MNKQELVNYINQNNKDLDNNLDASKLECLITNINALSGLLREDIKSNTDESNKIKGEIECFHEEIKLLESTLERIRKSKATSEADFEFCKNILPKVNDRLEAVLLHHEIDKLVDKMPTFEDALFLRVENYAKKMKEANPFEVEVDYDLERIFNMITDFIAPMGNGYIPADANWVATKHGYNNIIRSLCESQAMGKHITLQESSKRFDIIDNAIAKDEERLFK